MGGRDGRHPQEITGRVRHAEMNLRRRKIGENGLGFLLFLVGGIIRKEQPCEDDETDRHARHRQPCAKFIH